MNEGSFWGVKRLVKFTTHLHLVPRVVMIGAIRLLALYAFLAFRHTAYSDPLRKQDRQTVPVLQMVVNYTHYLNEFANLCTSLTLVFNCRCKSTVAKFIRLRSYKLFFFVFCLTYQYTIAKRIFNVKVIYVMAFTECS
jgi:hypothetical protein